MRRLSSSRGVVELTRCCWARGWWLSMMVINLVWRCWSHTMTGKLVWWWLSSLCNGDEPTRWMFSCDELVQCLSSLRSGFWCTIALAQWQGLHCMVTYSMLQEVSGGCGTRKVSHWELTNLHVCRWPDARQWDLSWSPSCSIKSVLRDAPHSRVPRYQTIWSKVIVFKMRSAIWSTFKTACQAVLNIFGYF